MLRSSAPSSSAVPAVAVFSSRVMPHFGQLPGWSCRISGCIGHVYCGLADVDVIAFELDDAESRLRTCGERICTDIIQLSFLRPISRTVQTIFAIIRHLLSGCILRG